MQDGPKRVTTNGDSERPNVARLFDYYLGGAHNFAVDRALAEETIKRFPVAEMARTIRSFSRRVVRLCVEEMGIRQFLDLGSGIPSAQATHEVAPDARVVYVDNDPVVGELAREILGAARDGRTAFLAEDFRTPEAVLGAPQTGELLDLSQPVAVILGALLHFVLDSQDPYATVEQYKRALAPGSLVILTHSSPDYVSPPVRAAVDELYVNLRVDLASRSRAEIERFVATEGWTVLDPGVVSVNEWETADERAADADRETSREDTAGYAAVARKD